jgi:oxygen-independent coproporphyrinogen-3 oxidase
LEETFFLGLRLNSGVDLEAVSANFGEDVVAQLSGTIAELISEGLVEKQASGIRLTSRGRLLSNEVFQRFLGRGQPARTRATKKTTGTNDHVIMQQHSP